MGGRLPDVRALVPREPTPEMRQWAVSRFREDLDLYGMVYSVEWAEDHGFAQMLDEWAKPRKTKMVRVRCSACGTSTLLNWGYSEKYGYGFVHPDEEEGDWAHTVTVHGDECTCPMCGARVQAIKQSTINPAKGAVLAEKYFMSVSVVGRERYLALTGWMMCSGVSKWGGDALHFYPMDAYVFGERNFVRLAGWKNAYSGKIGYFMSRYDTWHQLRDGGIEWDFEEEIFGLTEELVNGSCLPHCKLDVYMAGRPGCLHHAPLWYLRLYQLHPNVEAVLMHGLPRVLDRLIYHRVEAKSREGGGRRTIQLPEIDWKETRPAQMLHLTREELRMARARCWGHKLWSLFVGAKEIGEVLTDEDMVAAFELGDSDLAELLPFGQIRRAIHYLHRQLYMQSVECGDEAQDPMPDAMMLRDYWRMCQEVGRNLNDPAVRWPQDLVCAHDQVTWQARVRQTHQNAADFRVRRRALSKYFYRWAGLMIRPAKSQGELIAEGDALHHCVATYADRHAQGKTAIFFIRRVKRPWEPYYTLELDEQSLTVRQNRGLRNCERTREVAEFEDRWIKWVRAQSKPREMGHCA